MAYQNAKDDWPLDEKTLGTELVSIQVGKQKKEVAFHKKLLSSRSTAFEKHIKALDEKGKYQFHCEARVEHAFSVLVTYLYKGDVPACPTDDEDGPDSTSYGRQMRELYYLAERFEMVDLMDKTMDVIQVHDRRFDGREIYKHMREVYMNTARESSLRFYCALSAAWYFGRPCSPDDRRLTCLEAFKDQADILYDVVKTQLRFESHISRAESDYRIPSNESGLGPCSFHAHASGEMCRRLALLEHSASLQDHYKDSEQAAHTTGLGKSREQRTSDEIEESVQGSIRVGGSSETMDDVDDDDDDDEEDLLILTSTNGMKKIKREDSDSPTGKRAHEASDEEESSRRKRPVVMIGGSSSRDGRSQATGLPRAIQQAQLTNIKPKTFVLFNYSNGQVTATRRDSNHPTRVYLAH